MSIIERVKRMLSRTPDGFVERPKAQLANKHTGRTKTARIGRHKRVQVGLVDLANVCPVCGGLPTSEQNNGKILICANSHTWVA